jgi:putative ABC transport system permease protein
MRSYFVVLLRNLKREKLYAAINIAGLALGIACCLALGLFLYSELTYDRHHLKHERIFRVVNELSSDRFAVTSHSLGPMLAAEYPEVEAYVRFLPFESLVGTNTDRSGLALRHEDQVYYWDNVYFVDESVLDIFTHTVLYGDPATALKDTASIAVSETFAKAYFADENPIGKTILTDSDAVQRIDLVFADLPPNSHLKYDVLFSMNAPFLRTPNETSLRRLALFSLAEYTYLLMSPDFDPATWPRISDAFFNRHMAEGAKARDATWRSWLQPLAEIHFDSDLTYDRPTGNRMYLYGCVAVALFILIVASINYMNLATARAMRRARSVGLRKILGASRFSLGLQFLGEAILFSLIALVLGVVIVEVALTLTPLHELMGGQVNLNLREQPVLAAILLGVGLLIGVLSGIYPALYLSSWAPVSALAGTNLAGKGNLRLREMLVLLQFTLSAGVIACTLLMAAQMRYIADKSLGFEKENRLIVTLRGASTLDKLPALRSELAKNPRILGISSAEGMMGIDPRINSVQYEDESGAMKSTQVAHMPVGDDFISLMGFRIVQGRDFSRKLLTDTTTSLVVNEALVRRLGWTNPIGKRMSAGPISGRVIGVVADFNFRSLRSQVEPFVLWTQARDTSSINPIMRPWAQRLLVLKVSGEEVSETLGFVERIVRDADPKHPFAYAFLDDQLDTLYKSERQLMKFIATFSVICIFIACLGLFGLVAFATEQRTREIGTRKVLGASSLQIILMLSRRTLVLVGIAAAIASAISWLAMDEWLTGFAYRAGINPLYFVLAAGAAAVVAFATVALQSFKTARADPVEALRHV